jgi:large subunit ribosomal protein L3
MKFILGKKEYMTQIFDEEGKVIPVTLLQISPLVVTQVKTKDKDGYSAIQVGFGDRKAKNINKPAKGHMKDLGNFSKLKEVRLDKNAPSSEENKQWVVGDKIDAASFKEGDKVIISATSKGKGFQGVVKRHGFSGGPRSHGQKHSERAPGSIGTAGFQRVFKNMRMAGRMGSDRITYKNMKIVKIDQEANQIFIKGAIPGRKGTVVEIKG